MAIFTPPTLHLKKEVNTEHKKFYSNIKKGTRQSFFSESSSSKGFVVVFFLSKNYVKGGEHEGFQFKTI